MGESLTGDLEEEYNEGRCAAWYWRQVLSSIPLRVWKSMGSFHGFGFIDPI